MKRYDIVITKPAEEDLHGIVNYIAEELKEPSLAEKFIIKIGHAILDLENMPLRNALVNDEKLATQGFRKLIVDNYIVFYVVSERDYMVTIVRILYSRRDWSNIL